MTRPEQLASAPVLVGRHALGRGLRLLHRVDAVAHQAEGQAVRLRQALSARFRHLDEL